MTRPELDLPAQAEAAHVVDLFVADREAARGRLSARCERSGTSVFSRVEELGRRSADRNGRHPRREARSRRVQERLRGRSHHSAQAPPTRNCTRFAFGPSAHAAEVAEAVVGKPASRFVKRAKRLQDVAGELQDAAVAEERLVSNVSSGPEQPRSRTSGRAGAHGAQPLGRRSSSAWSKAEKTDFEPGPEQGGTRCGRRRGTRRRRQYGGSRSSAPLRRCGTSRKGRRSPARRIGACALREVEEETGLHCMLGPGASRHLPNRRSTPQGRALLAHDGALGRRSPCAPRGGRGAVARARSSPRRCCRMTVTARCSPPPSTAWKYHEHPVVRHASG